MLYLRELESYRNEWLGCEQKTENLQDWGPVSLNDFMQGSGLSENDFGLPDRRTAARFRSRLANNLRFPRWSLIPRRILSLASRVINKLLLKRKKIIPEGGLIIAISGVDGAGKTTMLNEAHRTFSKFLTVRQLALGKPQGVLLEGMRKLIRADKSRRNPQPGSSTNKRPCRRTSVLSSLSAAFLALLRLKMAYKARRYASRGYLVLADRWPTAVKGMMDGPKLESDPKASIVTRICAGVERWAYRRMPQADVCFFLQAPESILIDRNRKRDKQGKETDAEIINRSQKNQQFEPLAHNTVRFDNDGPLDQKRNELLMQIWNEIAAC
jgi:thymidylate kinase